MVKEFQNIAVLNGRHEKGMGLEEEEVRMSQTQLIAEAGRIVQHWIKAKI